MILAIDPGASGGFAAYSMVNPHDLLERFSSIAMPKTGREIVSALTPGLGFVPETDAPVAYLEDLVKYTGRNMPSSSMATYAGNWGFLKGALIALNYRIVIVPPKTWQKALGLGTAKGMSKTEWKTKLKNRAEQLFPGVKVTLATADALLILEAARRGLLG